MEIEIHKVYQNGRTITVTALLNNRKFKVLESIGRIHDDYPPLPFDYDRTTKQDYNTIFHVYDNKNDKSGRIVLGEYYAWLTPIQRYGLILMFGKAWFQNMNNLWKVIALIIGTLISLGIIKSCT